MKSKNINQLISDYLLGKASEEEQTQLEKWLQADPEHQEFFKQFAGKTEFSNLFRKYMSIDGEQAWRLFERNNIQTKTRPISPFFYRAAAIIILLIVGGAFWYHREYTRVTPPEISQEVEFAMQESQSKGWQGAEIITSATPQKQVITEEESARYHVDEDFAEQLADAKRITTYHDKEYWVTLDDGSLVHLNYDSRLIYPEKFGDRRDVILEGEAYFMVAHDKSRQFVVHTPQGDVAVHGTEFMVNTRKNENNKNNHDLSVVLVNGSIGFTPNNGKEVMMAPGQELSVVNNELSIHIVDTAIFTAWNTGTFMFEEEPLSSLMEVVSRWYGYKVIFADKAAESITITGNIDKYHSAEPFLETLERITQLNVSVNGKTVIIRSK